MIIQVIKYDQWIILSSFTLLMSTCLTIFFFFVKEDILRNARHTMKVSVVQCCLNSSVFRISSFTEESKSHMRKSKGFIQILKSFSRFGSCSVGLSLIWPNIGPKNSRILNVIKYFLLLIYMHILYIWCVCVWDAVRSHDRVRDSADHIVNVDLVLLWLPRLCTASPEIWDGCWM